MICFNDTSTSWGKDYKSQVSGHIMKRLSLHWLQILSNLRRDSSLFLKLEIPKGLDLAQSRGISPSSEPRLEANSSRPCRAQIPPSLPTSFPSQPSKSKVLATSQGRRGRQDGNLWVLHVLGN